jgi:predicted secreted protein
MAYSTTEGWRKRKELHLHRAIHPACLANTCGYCFATLPCPSFIGDALRRASHDRPLFDDEYLYPTPLSSYVGQR